MKSHSAHHSLLFTPLAEEFNLLCVWGDWQSVCLLFSSTSHGKLCERFYTVPHKPQTLSPIPQILEHYLKINIKKTQFFFNLIKITHTHTKYINSSPFRYTPQTTELSLSNLLLLIIRCGGSSAGWSGLANSQVCLILWSFLCSSLKCQSSLIPKCAAHTTSETIDVCKGLVSVTGLFPSDKSVIIMVQEWLAIVYIGLWCNTFLSTGSYSCHSTFTTH